MFTYNHQKAQSNERRGRIEQRRRLAEAAELDKENERQAEEREKENQEAAVEGLLLLRETCKVDVQTQTLPPVREAQASVCSTMPIMYSLPVEP